MAEKEACILTNMCMIRNGDKVLVQNRVNPNWPGFTFPGGHVEPRESFVESVIREVREETGLTIWDVQLCGIKQWTSKDGSYRYLVLFYKTSSFSGELTSSEEGDVFWMTVEELKKAPKPVGFSEMLEVFLDDALSENYHWYEAGEWKLQNL